MNVTISNFPVNIKKGEMVYDDFISLLSKKSTLNDISSAKIEFGGVESFDEKQENKIMELDSVKGLFNSI